MVLLIVVLVLWSSGNSTEVEINNFSIWSNSTPDDISIQNGVVES